jgi:hypothetical protein
MLKCLTSEHCNQQHSQLQGYREKTGGSNKTSPRIPRIGLDAGNTNQMVICRAPGCRAEHGVCKVMEKASPRETVPSGQTTRSSRADAKLM